MGDVVFRSGTGKEIACIGAVSGLVTSGVPGTAPATTASAGALALNTSDGKKVIELRAGDAAITVGGSGREGDVRVRDAKGKDVVLLNGGNGSSVVVLDSSKHRVFNSTTRAPGRWACTSVCTPARERSVPE